MYLGYYKIGNKEIANSARVAAYAERARLTWLRNCEECETLDLLLPRLTSSYSRNGKYVDPVTDPAPWYDPTNPDSEGFYGVMAMRADGVWGSTRKVLMTSTITGGSASGQTYYDSRQMVMQLLLVAEDECSLEYGLRWLSDLAATQSLCDGSDMLFWDCCPCSCSTSGITSGELDAPWDYATGTWDTATRLWDSSQRTIDSLLDRMDDYSYSTIDGSSGADDSCVDDCVLPYQRKMRTVQVTQGPTVLERYDRLSCGAAMLVELLVEAGDSAHYSLTDTVLSRAASLGTMTYQGATRSIENPVQRSFGMTRRAPLPHEMSDKPAPRPGQWESVVSVTPPDTFPLTMGGMLPEIILHGGKKDARNVLVTVEQDGTDVASFFLPDLPAHSEVQVNMVRRKIIGKLAHYEDELVGVVKGGDGGPVRWPKRLAARPFSLTVRRGSKEPLPVSVLLACVGDG